MSVFPTRPQAPLGKGPCLIHLFISTTYKAWLIVGTQMLNELMNDECIFKSPIME